MSGTNLSDDASVIIKEYLNAKTLNQIANETGISKGKVHYVIKDWKDKIAIPNIEEVRDFAVKVRKSGMSIKQCAQGFRMLQLLNNLGVGENNGDVKYDDDDDATNEIHYFIEKVHQNCKKLGIRPDIVPIWIRDLLDCYQTLNEKDDTQTQTQTFMGKPKNSTSNPYVDSTDPHSQIKRKESSSSPETKIPFISRVSNTIAQKKNECNRLDGYRQELKNNIDDLETQIEQARFDLSQITQNKKAAMDYLDLFSKLKKELWDNHNIIIEDDIQGFAKLINDFEIHGYDATKIINEYMKALSLELEIKSNEDKVQALQKQTTVLNNSVLTLQSQVNMHRQTLYTFSELEAMKFGMNELQQLWYTILEIAEANNASSQQAVSKFLKDVEGQYNRKLGLENKVNEKRNELAQLNGEINKNRLILQATPFIGTTLRNLFQNGVGEADIIGINNLAHQYKEVIIPLDVVSEGKDNKHDKAPGSDERGMWRLLADELKIWWHKNCYTRKIKRTGPN